MHKDAPAAHVASVLAQKQGKFWDYHDTLFENQKALKLDDLRRYAQETGLDLQRFDKDLLDLSNKKRVDDDKAQAAALGVTGTPAFFVNGRFLSGAKPFEEFATAINAELTRLGLPIPEGAGSP
jgi:protein-disulfide isomerase